MITGAQSCLANKARWVSFVTGDTCKIQLRQQTGERLLLFSGLAEEVAVYVQLTQQFLPLNVEYVKGF